MGKKRSKFKCYEKLLKKDGDYDFGYLLVMERLKLKRMVDSFTNASAPYVGIERDIRDMKLCISLIDIALEEDAKYMTWLDELSENTIISSKPTDKEGVSELVVEHKKDVYFPGYINYKNITRFMKGTVIDEKNHVIKSHTLVELRRLKALFLYNKIRNRMFHWWW